MVLGPLALVAGTGALAARAVISWPRGVDVAALRLNDASLAAFGPGDRPLWTFQLPPIGKPVYRSTAILDLDGDGRQDAVAAVNLLPDADAQTIGTLFAVDASGRQLWRNTIADSLTFGSGVFGGAWQTDDVAAFTSRGQPRIAWAVHHYTWWPSLLAVFDGRGARIGTFVNAGWIRFTRATADGRYLVAAGFSNSRDAAAFAILDADHPSGVSPEDAGSGYACRSCPPGRPLRYITIQWTDVATALPPDERSVMVIVPPGGGVELRAQQRPHTEAIVELSPALAITRATLSDNFWTAHTVLEREGALNHSRDRCAVRNGPIVREWTPERGWRDVGQSERRSPRERDVDARPPARAPSISQRRLSIP